MEYDLILAAVHSAQKIGKTMASILNTEILEQPVVIQELLDHETVAVKKIAKSISGTFKYVVIAARGTSDNAARYAQYLLGAHNHLQVALATPSLFSIYKTPPDISDALIIGISQSGQSPDIVSVLAEGKKQNCPTIAITNEERSPLAGQADFIIPLHAHQERAIAATKTYTTSLAALAMLSCSLAEDEDRWNELAKSPEFMQETIIAAQSVIQHSERYRYMGHCAVLGRGYNYSTAFEVALKVKELTRIVAEPYSSADFRHGPIATVTQGFPLILIAPSGLTSPDLADLCSHLHEMLAELLVISNDPEVLKYANLGLEIPVGLPEWLSPLAAIIPGQLFALNLAIERGLNPDQPIGLRKVTETL
jgi:glucosamine--fructose-6-phosphate aminotransferase (isomerizing)